MEINHLSEAELRELNRRIVERLEHLPFRIHDAHWIATQKDPDIRPELKPGSPILAEQRPVPKLSPDAESRLQKRLLKFHRYELLEDAVHVEHQRVHSCLGPILSGGGDLPQNELGQAEDFVVAIQGAIKLHPIQLFGREEPVRNLIEFGQHQAVGMSPQSSYTLMSDSGGIDSGIS